MERSLNPRIEKQSIYEIYRACRLCGAGAGYKMPIIQNVVDLDDQEVQLKQKISDCVQIEVHQDDKMPPLICELCVDKVNDFYEFLEMCKQTNIRTRLRLGLPPQSLPRGAPDAGDCILGLTETVYVNSDEDEPLSKRKRPHHSQKNKLKREPEVQIKIEKCPAKIEPRTTRHKSKRERTPPRVTRLSKSSKDSDDVTLSRLQDNPKTSRSQKPGPRSILKKEEKPKSDETSLLTPRSKRPRDNRDNKSVTPNKKVKIAVPSSSSRAKPSPTPPPRSRPAPATAPPPRPRPGPRRPATPPPAFNCAICHMTAKNGQGLASHMKSHTVGFTSPRMSCNACGLWFSSGDEALAHHRRHRSRGRPYACRRCTADFQHQAAYDEHFDKNQCIPYDVVPDVKCETCWHEFATGPLLDAHKCPGEDGRPGGKCPKCNRSYMLLKNLKRHEETCTAKRKGELIVDPKLLGKLKPIQVRVARCDPLLDNIKQEHFDVSTVSSDFGLDRSCIYPYISSVSSLRIKSEPEDFDSMVTIKQEIKEEFCTEENFVHWDSSSGSESEPEVTSIVVNPFAKRKRIDSLSTLSLKTIFSQRFLGKVPKKRRRVKLEHGFDSVLSFTAIDDSMRRDIDSIINNLGTDSPNESMDVGNDTDVVSDVSKDVSIDASKDVTIGDSNVSSTDDCHDSSEVFSNNIVNDTRDDSTRDKNNAKMKEDTDTSKVDCNNLPRDEINYLQKDVNNDSMNDDGDDLSKDESNDNIKKDKELKDENVKNDEETTVDHSNYSEISFNEDVLTDSPSVLEPILSDDLCNDNLNHCNNSENDMSTEMAGGSKDNDISGEKHNEFNDKSVDVCNDSSTAAVENNVEDDNKSKNVSTVNDEVEKAPENEVLHDSISLKVNNVTTEFIETKSVKNGSLSNEKETTVSNDKIKNVKNDSNSNLNCDSNVHNHIEQISVSNVKISLDSDHKNDEGNVCNDKVNVNNDSISTGHIEEKYSHLHVSNEENHKDNDSEHKNDKESVTNEKEFNENTRETDTEICNNDNKQQILNSKLDTAVLESTNNDKTSAVNTETLKDNSYMNETISSEDDDKRLMDELDAQIADNSGKNDSNDKRDVTNDKIMLEDLIAERNGENSLGLNSISDDDFNFDN